MVIGYYYISFLGICLSYNSPFESVLISRLLFVQWVVLLPSLDYFKTSCSNFYCCCCKHRLKTTQERKGFIFSLQDTVKDIVGGQGRLLSTTQKYKPWRNAACGSQDRSYLASFYSQDPLIQGMVLPAMARALLYQ